MSTPVVLVPGAPVLVPELSGAASAASASGVEATLRMLTTAVAGHDRVLVLGADAAGRETGDVRSSLVRWGSDVQVGRSESPEAGDSALPDAALIGWWLLDGAGIDLPRYFVGITGDGRGARHPGSDTLVVVVADGPASLSPRAPVPEDPRGVALDTALSGWLRSGGPLPDPGDETASSVGWWSRPAWLELSGLVGQRAAAETVSWSPFGVGYHCARWDRSSAVSPLPGGEG